MNTQLIVVGMLVLIVLLATYVVAPQFVLRQLIGM